MSSGALLFAVTDTRGISLSVIVNENRTAKMSLPSFNPGQSSSTFHPSHLRISSLPGKQLFVKMHGSSDCPSCFSSTIQECAFVLTATLATGQTSLFAGLIVCITSHVADDLHMSIAQVTWLSAAQASVPSHRTACLGNQYYYIGDLYPTLFHLGRSASCNSVADVRH